MGTIYGIVQGDKRLDSPRAVICAALATLHIQHCFDDSERQDETSGAPFC